MKTKRVLAVILAMLTLSFLPIVSTRAEPSYSLTMPDNSATLAYYQEQTNLGTISLTNMNDVSEVDIITPYTTLKNEAGDTIPATLLLKCKGNETIEMQNDGTTVQGGGSPVLYFDHPSYGNNRLPVNCILCLDQEYWDHGANPGIYTAMVTYRLTITDTSGIKSYEEVTQTLTLDMPLERLPIDEKNFPDSAFRSYISNKIDTDKNGVLSASEINAVTGINVKNKGIRSLEGLSFFAGITSLNCSRNELTSLDLSSNPNLEALVCYSNNLQVLDISPCPYLADAYMNGVDYEGYDEISYWIYTKDDCTLSVDLTTVVRPEAIVSPTITSHPSNKTVAAGEKATFKVVASGDDLTYQWQYSKNGTTWTDKAGATSASYTVTAKASYNGLYYRCKVSNAGGEVFSNKAKLTVTSTSKPVITTQPANKTVAAGTSATFQVVASGTGLTYQWQYSKNGTTWTDKAGATSASYTVTAKASYNGMLYRCIVTNAGGSVTSGTAKLTVTVAKPVITTQPKAQTAAVGATATYKVVASGTGLTYQWQYSSDYGATWHNKTGATSASYTVTAKASYNGMLYRCRVKNSGGTVYSSKVRLTVSGVKPKVLSQPKAATAAAGGTATFKVVAAGENMIYQWQYSTDGGTTWKNKTGATSASYTVTAKASYNGILYRCRVKNSYGTVYSESAKLTVS